MLNPIDYDRLLFDAVHGNKNIVKNFYVAKQVRCN